MYNTEKTDTIQFRLVLPSGVALQTRKRNSNSTTLLLRLREYERFRRYFRSEKQGSRKMFKKTYICRQIKRRNKLDNINNDQKIDN